MNLVVIGTGYVGLVTGVGFASLGNKVSFIDLDKNKIVKLQNKERRDRFFTAVPVTGPRWKVCDIAFTLVPRTLSQHNRQVPVFKNLRFAVYADTLHRLWAEGCLARTTPKRLFKFSAAGGVNECCLTCCLL